MNTTWLSAGLLALPLVAVLLEWLISLPGHWHPLYYYRQIATAIARRVNRPENGAKQQRLAGTLAMILLVGVPLISYWGFSVLADSPLLLQGLLLIFLLYGRPIDHDLKWVMKEIGDSQVTSARLRLSQWVLRDTHKLEQAQLVSAASESLVINLAQGWFGVLFWYALLGPYAALAYRLIEQLHWSWNPKLERYRHFSRRVSQLHQCLSYLPKQIMGLLMTLFGKIGQNIAARKLGFRWPVPSSGQLIGTASAWLNAELGGQRYYQGIAASFPLFGPKRKPPLIADFRLLRGRCYLVALNYLIFIIYPLLLIHYLVIGI